jgi:hypothetical protein
MGHFDALASSSFKTAAHGRRLFFPWGIWGRGYVIASEQDYQRLRQQIKTYYVVSLAVIIGSVVLKIYFGDVFMAVFLGFFVAVSLGFYLLWMRSLLPRLEPSSERLSREECMTTQARLHGAVGLWLLEIVALAFVGDGILLLILAPAQHWQTGLATIVLFGLCAIVVARMLVLRRRPAPGADQASL